MIHKRYFIPLIVSLLFAVFVVIVFGINNHAGDYCIGLVNLDPDNCPIDYDLLIMNLFFPVFLWFTLFLYVPIFLWQLFYKLSKKS
ncbi:hypothetical protein [Marinomonas sp.]|uniref:hypothetical protein n=1 Tax=Marinomonas sp. TaxID=1904862 RepID=UPI003BA87C3E